MSILTDFCDVIDLHGMTYDRIMFLIELRWTQLRILPVKDNRPALYRSPSLSPWVQSQSILRVKPSSDTGPGHCGHCGHGPDTAVPEHSAACLVASYFIVTSLQ